MSPSIISKGIKTNNLIFLSGMTAEGPDTGAQIRNIFTKVENVLIEVGSSLNNIIAATVYLTDLDDRPKYLNPIWSEYFPQNPPTRTTIQVGLAPPAKVEITIIATSPEIKIS